MAQIITTARALRDGPVAARCNQSHIDGNECGNLSHPPASNPIGDNTVRSTCNRQTQAGWLIGRGGPARRGPESEQNCPK
jgi:hypothetical protein